MANLRFRRSRDGPSSVLVAWRGHPGEDSWEPTSEFHPDDLAGVPELPGVRGTSGPELRIIATIFFNSYHPCRV